MKRLTAVLLICALLMGACPALAASDSAQVAADTLYELGLFKGTGTDADGSPVYDLDAAPTRIQALIMMLRLLGVEYTATRMPLHHPFTDVPGWAAPYVGFAYVNGITLGMSEDTFGTDMPAQPNMYLTFVLRALGYSDSWDGADFSYNSAGEFVKAIGLTDRDYVEEFTRGDVAEISFRALSLALKGTDTTLIQHLVSGYAVGEQAARNAGFSVEPPKEGGTVAVPAHYSERFRYYYIISLDLKAAFPSAVGVLHTGNYYYPPEMLYSDTYSKKEMEFLWALHQSEALTNGNYSSLLNDGGSPSFPHIYSAYYILDADYNILGIWRADEEVANDYIFVTRGGDGIDGAKLYKAFLENPAILPAN